MTLFAAARAERFRRTCLPWIVVCAALLPATGAALAVDEGHAFLLRFPTIQGGQVAFCAGGDVWIAPVAGGEAVRLTVDDGEESFPRLSPDGALIAFSGEYDGNRDVYVMDTHGGGITRVTYHPGADQVLGWCAAKHKILFASPRHSFSRFVRLFLIAPDGSGLEEVPLPEAAHGSFSPDGKRLAYCKISYDERTWKRYRGGLAPDVYVVDLATRREINLTNNNAIDNNPMWIGDRIYFTSDRDGVLNLWSCDSTGGGLEQHTRYTQADYDVRRPSADASRIVYELGGDLYAYDTAAREARRLAIAVHADTPELRPYRKSVDGFVTELDAAPDGKSALLTARGDLFTVPREDGLTRNLTRSCGVRDRGAVWSPDGQTIAYVSDADGEYNLYTIDAAGNAPPRRLTAFTDGYRHALRWSPDGKKLGFTDQTLTLSYLDVATGKIAKVDKAEYENIDVSLAVKDIYDYCWSPDSRFIAYAKMDASLVNKLYVHALDTGRNVCVSDGAFNDFHPVFAPDGEHLFFVSNRRFDPTFCDFEWEMVYKKMAGIYALTLRRDGPALFPPAAVADAVPVSPPKKAPKSAAKGAQEPDGSSGPKPVTIDFDGLARRVEALPLPRGNYRDLVAGDGVLYYLDADEGDFNRFEFRVGTPRDLHAFDLEEEEDRTIVTGIDAYRLAGDGATLFYRRGSQVGTIGTRETGGKGTPLALDELKVPFDPLAEWRQIFHESWRMERDFYYDPAMRGLNWAAMRVKYGRMLERATCRQDVRYVVGELIGELNTSHTYVAGGDVRRRGASVGVGLLGADYDSDPASGRYRFRKIYGEMDWNGDERPPLVGPGLSVQPGDYLLQVDGVDVRTDRSVYSYFVGLADRLVELTVNDRPTAQGARTVLVKPVANETSLRYLDWVEGNRRHVEQLSGGTIGYIHFPDTYTGSAALFARYFYSQTTKQGIIVDGRFNAGGLDPAIFLQRLGKRPQSYWTRRQSHDFAEPWLGTNAQMVCLTNRNAGSGGDALPYEFRELGLGPVVGTRSWGGLVGISMEIPMVDGGTVTAPDYRVYDPRGRWIIENEGVAPDVVVDLDPADFGTGRDAQLAKAYELLARQIEASPRPWPQHEPIPANR